MRITLMRKFNSVRSGVDVNGIFWMLQNGADSAINCTVIVPGVYGRQTGEYINVNTTYGSRIMCDWEFSLLVGSVSTKTIPGRFGSRLDLGIVQEFIYAPCIAFTWRDVGSSRYNGIQDAAEAAVLLCNRVFSVLTMYMQGDD